MTDGAIDGCSRLVLYIHCRSNNRAVTVLNLFVGAVSKYGLPSRVRSDQGHENTLVARYMIEKRGAIRNSMLVGSSTHNKCIERLWKDMHKGVTLLFYKLFYFVEDQGILDPLNEHHIWALHYVFFLELRRHWKILLLRRITTGFPQLVTTLHISCLLLALNCYSTPIEKHSTFYTMCTMTMVMMKVVRL